LAVDRWLIDKSALVRLGQSDDAMLWSSRIERGLISICTVTRLEIGYSARSAADLREITTTVPVAALLVEYFTPAVEERALEVQRLLAERGQHRAPSLPDLLIAATAELTNLIVLHRDKDFELIAAITGQTVEWLRM
jgi:predicted nucleic acid-binding protein